MFAKLMSISDELMWRYYALLTDLSPAEIAAERAAGPADGVEDRRSAARIVADFHGPAAAAAAEEEWRRVHQQRQAPSELRVGRACRAGAHKPHDAARGRRPRAARRARRCGSLRQRAVRRDGVVARRRR